MKQSFLLPAWTVAAFGAGACRSATGTEPLLAPAHAAVYGRVADADGTARGKVLVAAAGFAAACGAGERVASGSEFSVPTDADGRYRIVLNTRSPAALCVRAWVVGPFGGVVVGADAAGVPFRPIDVSAAVGRELRDSVRIDLTVP